MPRTETKKGAKRKMRKLLCIVSVLCALLMMCPTALAEGATSDASEPETSEVLTIGATEAQADGDASDVSEAVSDQPTAAMLSTARSATEINLIFI